MHLWGFVFFADSKQANHYNKMNTKYIQNIELVTARFNKTYTEAADKYREMYSLELEVGMGRTPDEIHESVLDRMIQLYQSEERK